MFTGKEALEFIKSTARGFAKKKMYVYIVRFHLYTIRSDVYTVNKLN